MRDGPMQNTPNAAPLALFEALETRQLLSVSLGANGWTSVTPSSDTRVIYVSNSEGNDANTGLSATSPLKSISAGVALLRSAMPDWLLLMRSASWVGEGLSSWSNYRR